jgi:hypothetical protein
MVFIPSDIASLNDQVRHFITEPTETVGLLRQ